MHPGNRPEQTLISETDFSFQEQPIEALYRESTFSAIFVATEPVAEQGPTA